MAAEPEARFPKKFHRRSVSSTAKVAHSPISLENVARASARPGFVRNPQEGSHSTSEEAGLSRSLKNQKGRELRNLDERRCIKGQASMVSEVKVNNS